LLPGLLPGRSPARVQGEALAARKGRAATEGQSSRRLLAEWNTAPGASPGSV